MSTTMSTTMNATERPELAAIGQPGDRPSGRRIDWNDDRGQVAGIEVLPFSVLIFVVGSLMVANAWAVIDVKFAVNAASREAVRAFVEAPDRDTATYRAERVARDAIAAHGRNPSKVTIHPPVYGVSGDGSFERCTPVTITVSYRAPAITLPLINSYGDGMTVTSSHTEVIDPYRSGVKTGPESVDAGVVQC
jgi:hypothetical protein